MGKRQIRIHRKDLHHRAPELLQQPFVQVLLQSRTVFSGKPLHLSKQELQLQDLRFNRHTLPLEQVEEVIYDVEAAW